MSPKRPPSNERPAPDAWQITDEWGIYDPAKAGMQALYARLGKPVLRDSTSPRKHRRRAARPERPAEGVGEALNEARRRAGLLPPSGEFEAIPQSPARAMRAALHARGAHAEPPSPHVPPPVEHEPAPPRTEPKPTARKRVARKTAAAERPGRTATTAAAPEAQKVRARPALRARAKAAAAPTTAPAAPPRHQPPAPAPGRPRGPVPLAAWARSVVDAAPAPAPADKRGFWRRVFLIPSEVALVEYARGCRIHRLLIEAADDPVPDFI